MLLRTQDKIVNLDRFSIITVVEEPVDSYVLRAWEPSYSPEYESYYTDLAPVRDSKDEALEDLEILEHLLITRDGYIEFYYELKTRGAGRVIQWKRIDPNNLPRDMIYLFWAYGGVHLGCYNPYYKDNEGYPIWTDNDYYENDYKGVRWYAELQPPPGEEWDTDIE